MNSGLCPLGISDACCSWALLLGTFTGHPHEVVPGGLGGVETALKDLKYVFRIAEGTIGRDPSI